MKRFVLFIFGMFTCIGAIAETTDLKFVIDNETYATQTCTVGGGVDLPPTPTKYGYDFDGWQPVFYRGTFATWNDIPTSTAGYIADTNGSNIPHENDYIIVNDASGVPKCGEKIEIQVSTSQYGLTWTGYCRTYIDGTNYGCDITNTEGDITILNGVYDGRFGTRWESNKKSIYYKGKIYDVGNVFLTLHKKVEFNGTYYACFINSYPYSGKWLLRYHGNWDDYNRGGWIPEKQLD